MKLTDLLKSIKHYETNGEIDDVEVEGLTLDNRKCRKNSAFFAIKGLVTDGHKFVESAGENGASVAFVEEFVYSDILQIKVADTRSTMSVMAAAFFGNPAHSMRFLGVTGTNGKTSITFMIRSVLETEGVRTGLIGTSGIYAGNQKIEFPISTSTTPDPIELQEILAILLKKGVQTVIMEVTAQSLYLRKVEDIVFDAAAFTNLTQDHLEFFGTMEVYAAAKKRLFFPEKCRCAVINTDDALGKEIAMETECRLITCGTAGKEDMHAADIILGGQNSSFNLEMNGEREKVELAITGKFNINNALCAMGVLIGSGIDKHAVIRDIKNFTGTPGRYETPDMKGRDYSVVIDYAHTPDGLENILSAVRNSAKGRVIAVFGCGGNRDTKKRPIMGEIAARLSDFCIITSDNPRCEDPDDIISQVEAGIPTGSRYTKIENRREAIKFAMDFAEKGDIIVIAGKGDEDYQEINGIKHHFSDRETVAELLG